jgi:hypothetical protein
MNDDIQARIAASKASLQTQISNQQGGEQNAFAAPSPPSPVQASVSQCPQCGHFHPPVDGECPLKQQKTEDGKVIDPNPFLEKMRDIVMSQMQMRKVKNPEKFFAHLIVELTKSMENYSE